MLIKCDKLKSGVYRAALIPNLHYHSRSAYKQRWQLCLKSRKQFMWYLKKIWN